MTSLAGDVLAAASAAAMLAAMKVTPIKTVTSEKNGLKADSISLPNKPIF
jgi:hypothetical protein